MHYTVSKFGRIDKKTLRRKNDRAIDYGQGILFVNNLTYTSKYSSIVNDLVDLTAGKRIMGAAENATASAAG